MKPKKSPKRQTRAISGLAPKSVTESAADASAIVERGMELYRKGQLTELRELVHPEAEIQMLFLAGDVARGPDGVEKALREAADSIHKPTGTHVEGIDDHAAVLIGRILHEAPGGGLSDHPAAWLNVTRDGLMWRVLICHDAAEARHIYETRFRRTSE